MKALRSRFSIVVIGVCILFSFLITSDSYARGSKVKEGIERQSTLSSSAVGKKVSQSTYPTSLHRMTMQQFQEYGQTDRYRSAPAYIHRGLVKVKGKSGTVINKKMTVVAKHGTPLQAKPSVDAVPLTSLPNQAKIEYVTQLTTGHLTWYKVKYGTKQGYILSSAIIGSSTILSEPRFDSHGYGHINPGEKIEVIGKRGNYYQISYRRPAGHDVRIFDNTWRRARISDIRAYVDPGKIAPTSEAFYQFLDLSKSAGTTAKTLNRVLVSKGTLSGKGQSFITASNKYNVNEIYLLSHALLETGHGSSRLAKGVPVDKNGNALINAKGARIHPTRPIAKTVYNMYGIRATDSNPLGNGAKFAFEQKWFTPEAAIIGGAYWIGESYINHPTYRQNTLYKMRFNPAAPGSHQYATDIGWASKQTASIYNIYRTLDRYTLHFDVPKFQ
ncbi:N-acetylglucosaminidase [Exiguobacterium sp. SH0S1]|uniref:N-acetylglucosaminidase n=1 Tax=Exiguobacterium sp. SH0S1 TaxID=2510949 RepID=UPI001F30FD58|nr:N-acetylglucosaminidase [Exiguobacterium sp. SH0S1]